MKVTVDALGKPCPMPVVEAKKALKGVAVGALVEVLVDNDIAVQNLSKMAEQKKLGINAQKVNENHYVVSLTVGAQDEEVNSISQENIACQPASEARTVVVLASDKMGEGDEKLGHLLMKGFIYALTEQDELPQTVLLYNRGAYLSAGESESVADLKFLESKGVEILTCGTCLNHYGLGDKLAVGNVTNMYVIVEKQLQATKIIRP
ncbi:MAG: sulfurtransferase-like selenium metabolism protein YedF [Cellulosilyticaceae bacterium]